MLTEIWPFLLEAPTFTGGSDGSTGLQEYLFYAYGAAFVVLLLFCFYCVAQTKKIGDKVRYLSERFDRAHPELSDGERGES